MDVNFPGEYELSVPNSISLWLLQSPASAKKGNLAIAIDLETDLRNGWAHRYTSMTIDY